MQVIEFPERKDWKKILQRPLLDHRSLEAKVNVILQEVKQNGDAAVRHYSSLFDKVTLNEIAVSEAEIAEADQLVTEELKEAIGQAKLNIEAFHSRQLISVEEINT